MIDEKHLSDHQIDELLAKLNEIQVNTGTSIYILASEFSINPKKLMGIFLKNYQELFEKAIDQTNNDLVGDGDNNDDSV